jgi:hypothetical protein
MEEISVRIVRNNNWYEPGMVAADNLSRRRQPPACAGADQDLRSDEIQRLFDQY